MAKIVTAFRLPTKVIGLFGVLRCSRPLLVTETGHPSRISYFDGVVAVAHEGSYECELLGRTPFPGRSKWDGIDRKFSPIHSCPFRLWAR
jgi:hypothetical protein